MMTWLEPIKTYSPLVVVVLIFILQGARLLWKIRSSGVDQDSFRTLSMNYTVALVTGVFIVIEAIRLSVRYDVGHAVYYIAGATILLVQTHVEALRLMMRDKR